jgi:hypothetical protein
MRQYSLPFHTLLKDILQKAAYFPNYPVLCLLLLPVDKNKRHNLHQPGQPEQAV